ncbi:MAG: DUF4062 domain-containing protein [Planctomycetaceae bacterium]|jgi:hypothetical protein|nr:DUF4062 domain-containing protein [Planctomycetaceae bacterium]
MSQTVAANLGFSATVYRIFIASPSDVMEERRIVREVIDRWNSLHSQKEQKILLPIGWDTHSYPQSGNPPQDVINQQVLRNADILIGVFWQRVGTPTDEYPSGSVEEYERHIKVNKPAMIYFSKEPLPQDHDTKQFQSVKDFKDSVHDKSLYGEYENKQEFGDKLFDHLTLLVSGIPAMSVSGGGAKEEPQIGDMARQLLIAAVEDGGSLILLPHFGGLAFGSFKRRKDVNNNRGEAEVKGSYKQLENAGLIEAASPKREVFNVTDKGYEWADKNKQS